MPGSDGKASSGADGDSSRDTSASSSSSGAPVRRSNTRASCTCQRDKGAVPSPDAPAMQRQAGKRGRAKSTGITSRSRAADEVGHREADKRHYTRAAAAAAAAADIRGATRRSPPLAARHDGPSASTTSTRRSRDAGRRSPAASKVQDQQHHHQHHAQPARQSGSTSRAARIPSARGEQPASASALPWAIGANDDAPHGGLAFTFLPDSGVRSEARVERERKATGLVPSPAEDALSKALAPFLFDDTDGDEVHPLAPAARRPSSLPARLSPPGNISGHPSLESASQRTLSDQMQDWLAGSAPTLHRQQASSSSSSSPSDLSARSTLNSDASACSTDTAATSVSTTSPSDPSSPTSSQEGCTRKHRKHSQSAHSSPFSFKRSSDTFALDDPDRLKKCKLSHRIRSFLLLRPPGFPLPGTDGAADIQHILRAPPWLKNATSELSRESRMAPHEWEWADTSSFSSNWTITTLERKFKNLLKNNMDQEDLEKEERDSLSRLSPLPLSTSRASPENDLHMEGTVEKHNESMASTLQLSHVRTQSPKERMRQVSAPPNMEADPEKIANDLISPPQHGITSDAHESSISQAFSSPPPQVLKSQLLAVLRSRLPEGAKTGDAPLRMKKFVVWNAWVRRSTILSSRSRYRHRSVSPQPLTPVEPGDSKSTASSTGSLVQSYSSDLEASHLVIDIDASTQLNGANTCKSHQSGSSFSCPPPESAGVARESTRHKDDVDNSHTHHTTEEAPSTVTTSLVLMMHDETARSARRFSRAFDEDQGNLTDAQFVQNEVAGSMLDGPFMNSRSESDEGYGSEYVPMSDSNSLHLHGPTPVYHNHPQHASYKYHVDPYRSSSSDEYTMLDDEDMDHNLQQNRPISPLSARLQLKVSTATPPSQSVDLSRDNDVPSAFHQSYRQQHSYGDMHHDRAENSESSIVPFWFDQGSVTFDNEEQESSSESQNPQRTPNPASPSDGGSSPSLSPNNQKEMVDFTSSRHRKTPSGDWHHSLKMV